MSEHGGHERDNLDVKPREGVSLMQNLLVGMMLRWLRTAVSGAIVVWIAHNQNNPAYLAAQPFIAAVGKFLRDKYNLDWVPF